MRNTILVVIMMLSRIIKTMLTNNEDYDDNNRNQNKHNNNHDEHTRNDVDHMANTSS